MNNEQSEFTFDADFDALLEHSDETFSDKAIAQKRYKQHLWELVLVVERRLKEEGFDEKLSYSLTCKIIAEIAHYEGGEMRYLPRGERLKQALRDVQMFKLWHLHSWPVDKIHKQFCPELNIIEVYKILRIKRQEHIARNQLSLL